ncbi:MAG: SpoIVB peptidase [Christensenellales bacterium]|jgi:stage IV sporulation protein B
MRNKKYEKNGDYQNLLKKWNRAVGWMMAFTILALNFTPQAQSIRSLPDTVSFVKGQEISFDFVLPMTVSYEGEAAQVLSNEGETLSDVGVKGMTLTSSQEGKGTITLSLFGFIPVKTMTVSVLDDMVLIPGGLAVGVTLRTQGVLVVGMSPVTLENGQQICPVREAGLNPGDTIVAVNGGEVTDTESLIGLVSKAQREGEGVQLTVMRYGETMLFDVEPVSDSSGQPKLGLWARDSTNGVGTLTYYDPSTKLFGALGHPITDADTGALLPVRSGHLYPAEIVGTKKGERGAPGELKGVFGTDSPSIGTLTDNTLYGVFGGIIGNVSGLLYPEGLPVAGRSSVELGKASIISTVDKDGPKEYECEILQVFRQDSISGKSLVVKITDEELLAKTGGIVQGMSGSPIIQNGHIVGAITHVYVSDPTRGYGIYIEWMLGAVE